MKPNHWRESLINPWENIATVKCNTHSFLHLISSSLLSFCVLHYLAPFFFVLCAHIYFMHVTKCVTETVPLLHYIQ